MSAKCKKYELALVTIVISLWNSASLLCHSIFCAFVLCPSNQNTTQESSVFTPSSKRHPCASVHTVSDARKHTLRDIFCLLKQLSLSVLRMWYLIAPDYVDLRVVLCFGLLMLT